jgi:hypothetical protein
MLKLGNRTMMHRLTLSVFLVAVTSGCGSNAEPYDLEQEVRDQAASASASPSSSSNLINPYSLGFIGLCDAPDSLFEVKSDSKLIDKGLLLPTDVEGSLKTLGIDLNNRAGWLKDDIDEHGPIPDETLFSDMEILAEEILKTRIAILSGKLVSVDEQVKNVEALFERGKKVCDWHDKNS